LGWIAGIAVVVLIAFVVFAGIKQRHQYRKRQTIGDDRECAERQHEVSEHYWLRLHHSR
jgi:hypothetical protein